MPNALELYRRLDRGPLTTIMTDFDEVFSRAFRNSGFVSSGERPQQKELFDPRVELEELEQSYVLSFDIPGVKKEDLKIDLLGRTLTVSGERRREIRDKDGKAGSRSSGSFEKRFTLPDSIQTELLEAKLEDGVLRLTLPKIELPKTRSIHIQANSPTE